MILMKIIKMLSADVRF